MSYCIVIPNYNHRSVIADVLADLSQLQLPIVMVNDGSDSEISAYFRTLKAQFSCLTLVEHSDNQGKGAAVQTGLRTAQKIGCSHAIQVDADGQHQLRDVAHLLQLSEQQPNCVISGQPVYDESVPKHRLYSRYITHFWVWVETLSFAIKDSMCGFRVYPVDTTVALLDSVSLGQRMDFDIEILVRLYWRGVNTVFFPTQVIYPEDGISHFRPLEDNIAISWMHTRLFFGMLVRSPVLLFRKVWRHGD